MAERNFVWLADSCEARNGTRLERGKSYSTAGFPEGVPEEWVSSGAAAWADKKPDKSKEE